MKNFIPLLLPLRTAPKQKEIVGFDTETYGPTNEFQIGVVSSKRGDYLFTDAQAMLDFLCRKEFWNCHVFATNLGFDAFAIFQSVAGGAQMPPGWSFFDNGSKLIWVKKTVAEEIRKSTGKQKFRYHTFLDSLNIYQAGVESMGELLLKVAKSTGNNYFEEAKLKAPSWLGTKPWDSLSTVEKKELAMYCAADARVTRKFMEWFSQEIVNLGGELKLTAASTALDLFRRKYLREANLAIPQPSFEAMIESRFSYYGGRTEDFVKGLTHDVWDYDFTSMYPSAMVEIEYPYPSPEKFIKQTDPPESIINLEGFSKVRIRVPYMDLPPLPFRTEDKLLFPYGLLEGVWTNLELRYAIELGCVIEEVEWTYTNTKTFNPFREYVTDLFAKRMLYNSQKMATEEVIKLFLNGLYGKFAQNFLTEEQGNELGIKVKKAGGTFKRIEEASEEELVYTGQNFPEYLAKGYVINKAIPKLKAFMNPILSSYTTARARVKLHAAMLQAQECGAQVLYTDTDSLYVTKRLPFAVPDKQLGLLQEGKKYTEMLIVSPKCKRLLREDGKIITTAKGVPMKTKLRTFKTQRAIDIKPREILFNSMKLGKVKTRYAKFLRFKEAIARGLLPNQVVPMEKEFDPLEFPKRRIVGTPSIVELLSRQFQTVPWEIDAKTQLVIGDEHI